MANSSIPIASFVRERVVDIEQAIPSIREYEAGTSSIGKKRNFSSIFYRTGSYRTYKMPRRERKKEKSKSKKRKMMVKPSKKKDHRPDRRRPSLLTGQLLQSHATPADLLKDGHVKLPTHIYMRKRMHMVKQFGFSVASRCSCRGLRTLDRYWAAGKCFLQDSSFLRPIEMKGPAEDMASVLQSLLDPSCYLLELVKTMSRKFTSTEVTAMLHEWNSFPRGALGPVEVSVRADRSVKGTAVHALFWTHPGMLVSLYDALEAAVSDTSSCTVALFQRPLCRLTLVGPAARQVLLDTLHPARVQADIYARDYGREHFSFFQRSMQAANTLHNVWKPGHILSLAAAHPHCHHTSDDDSSKIIMAKMRWPAFADDSKLWTASARPADHQPDQPTGEDANTLAASAKMTESEHNMHHHDAREQAWDALESIWKDCQRKDNYAKTKAAKAVERLFDQGQGSAGTGAIMPVLVVHNHSTQTAASLCDRVLPQTFNLIVGSDDVRALFTALMKHKVNLLGSEEMTYLQHKHNLLSYPRDYPDTAAGWQHWNDCYDQHLAFLRRRPSNKRGVTAYSKYSFHAWYAGFGRIRDWLRYHEQQCQQTIEMDTEEVATDEEEEKVDEAVDILDGDDAADMVEETELPAPVMPDFVVIRNLSYLPSFLPDPAEESPSLPQLPQLTLVHVQLRPLCKGLPRAAALILAPSAADYEQILSCYQERRHPAREKDICRSYQRAHLGWTGAKISAASLSELSAQAAACHASASSIDAACLNGRQVLGFVTSGSAPHTNLTNKLSHEAGDNLPGFASIGLAHAGLLFDHMALPSHGDRTRNDFVLFWNYGSHWLRPAIVKFL